jgi:hypothetical protein
MRDHAACLRLRRVARICRSAVCGSALCFVVPAAAQEEAATALKLAELLRSARAVVSSYQPLINDPTLGEKGLSPDKVLAEAIEQYRRKTGEDPRDVDPASQLGRLFAAQMESIKTVVKENQETIDMPGIGFKGFIPATFARLVNEEFEARVGTEARIKVTAPPRLVRNRKARPDAWEAAVISEKLADAAWPKGKYFEEASVVERRPAFRILIPEYYEESCLVCHGKPAGEVDVTGYPKEGGSAGDLGAAISVTLFR